MTRDERGQTGTANWTRRSVLSVAAATALAGCSGFESYEFAADPAVLPDDERRSLGLAEVTSEPTTLQRSTEAGGVDVDVTIRSHLAIYESADSGGTAPPASWPDGDLGVGLLATPAARIADRSVNPLVGVPLGEIVRSRQGTELLSRAGVGDATVERGLEAVASGETAMLGETTSLRSFAGVVSEADRTRAILVHVARVAPGDVVVGALVHGRPVDKTTGPLVGPEGLLAPATVDAGRAAAGRTFGAVVVREG